MQEVWLWYVRCGQERKQMVILCT